MAQKFENEEEKELFLFTFVTGHIWNDVPKVEIWDLVDSNFDGIQKEEFNRTYSDALTSL